MNNNIISNLNEIVLSIVREIDCGNIPKYIFTGSNSDYIDQYLYSKNLPLVAGDRKTQ
jgi:hypothetical protein